MPSTLYVKSPRLDKATLKPTWTQLIEAEPCLEPLRYRAECFRKKVRNAQARDRFWYEALKPQMERHVGWLRVTQHPVLSTTEAYEVAYDAICDALGFY